MTSPLFDLTGQVALVTGASRGLGLYFARALARCGADIIMTARRKEDLASSVAEIEAIGRKAIPLALDVRDQLSIEAMAKAAEAPSGRSISSSTTLAATSASPHLTSPGTIGT